MATTTEINLYAFGEVLLDIHNEVNDFMKEEFEFPSGKEADERALKELENQRDAATLHGTLIDWAKEFIETYEYEDSDTYYGDIEGFVASKLSRLTDEDWVSEIPGKRLGY